MNIHEFTIKEHEAVRREHESTKDKLKAAIEKGRADSKLSEENIRQLLSDI